MISNNLSYEKKKRIQNVINNQLVDDNIIIWSKEELANDSQLKEGYDRTGELKAEELSHSKNISYSSNKEDLKAADVYIVTVPTPVDDVNHPDLTIIKSVCKLVGSYLKQKNIVIFASIGSLIALCFIDSLHLEILRFRFLWFYSALIISFAKVYFPDMMIYSNK